MIIKCEICGIYFESHKYYSHLLKDHEVTNIYTDIRLNPNKKELSVHSNIPSKIKSNKKKLTIKKQKQNKIKIVTKPTIYPDKRVFGEPDGSRGYHNIREHDGRFGSFPSFEPMDDE